MLRDPFYLILPQGFRGAVNDLSALSEKLPFVRFTATTPVGRKIDQHLRRVRATIHRTIEADRSSMVMAVVAAGQGFSIMSPTLLIDGIVEGMGVAVRALPITQLSRTITLVARSGELRDLPTVLAAEIATTLSRAIEEKVGPLLPVRNS